MRRKAVPPEFPVAGGPLAGAQRLSHEDPCVWAYGATFVRHVSDLLIESDIANHSLVRIEVDRDMAICDSLSFRQQEQVAPEPLPAEIRMNSDVFKGETVVCSEEYKQTNDPPAMLTHEGRPRAQNFCVVFEHRAWFHADHGYPGLIRRLNTGFDGRQVIWLCAAYGEQRFRCRHGCRPSAAASQTPRTPSYASPRAGCNPRGPSRAVSGRSGAVAQSPAPRAAGVP